MTIARKYWYTRLAILLTACALLLLLTRPAHASAANDAARSWARAEVLPRLTARAVAAPEHAAPLRTLGDTLAGDDGLSTETATDRNAAFWSVAASSEADYAYALTLRTTLLLAEGRMKAAAQHYALARSFGANGPAADILGQLGQLFPHVTAGDPLAAAEAALDRRDYALAALAYRAAILRGESAGARDLPGHYLYCLHRLGHAQPVSEPRARVLRTVVFPSIEAASLARVGADATRHAAAN